MERRALLALVLSFAVVAIWNKLFLPPPPLESLPSSLPAAVEAVEPSSPTVAGSQDLDALGDVTGSEREDQAQFVLQRQTFDTPLYEAEFTSVGGGPSSWTLARFTERSNTEGVLAWLWSGIKAGFEFSALTTSEPSPKVRLLDDGLEGASVVVSLGGRSGGGLPKTRISSFDQDSIAFVSTEAGVQVTRIFRLGGDDYVVDITVELLNQTDSAWSGTPTLMLSEHAHPASAGALDVRNRMAVLDGEGEFLDVEDLEGDEVDTLTGEIGWFGVGDHYFMSSIIMDRPQSGVLTTSRSGDRLVMAFTPSETLTIQPGEAVTQSYRSYLGPKDLEHLKAVGSDLDKAIDFGFFSIFAYPLLALLKFFYGIVGSYGVAIVLLTLSMKALTFPLTQKSMESMHRMKEIQPEIKKLQEKFADNKEALNQEMMRLMSEKKVNPLGGCLPTVVQLPVWFALYRVLQSSIELYHTSFLYLGDLSAADPYGVSPVVFAALMIFQQRMTPTTTMDPTQQRMMQMMPIVFSFIMFGLPSGLVLYMLVNSALSIAHHVAFNRFKAVAA